MKSIRWSLLSYFLMVLAVALGAVSLLAYEQMKETVTKREKAAAQLIEKQHEENAKKARDKLDEKLLGQAQTLVSLAQFQINSSHIRFRATAQVGQLTSTLGPNPCATAGGVMQALTFMYQTAQGPFGEALHRNNFAELQFNEQELYRDTEDSETEYFQVDSNFGNSSWRSHSMGTRSFPVDPSVFRPPQLPRYKSTLGALLAYSVAGPLPVLPALGLRPEEPPPPLFGSQAEDREIEPGHIVRCVTLKAPLATVNWHFPNSTPRGGGRPGGIGGPRPEAPRLPERPFLFYVQCASETTERDRQLADLGQQLKLDLDEIQVESQANLASLRNHLLLIAVFAFAAAAVGGYLLVRLGLSPLHRLSDAVSKVSARDFRLPLSDSRFPVELRPIVERLTQTLDELKRAFAREKQAVADISHDLRTPVASLLTTTEVSLRKQRSAGDYRAVIEDCHVIGQQMNRLIERLLALARLDAGVQTLRPCEVDVANLAQECVDMVRPLAEGRQLHLQLHRNGPVFLRTDPDKLREVLNNLLHNAIQYNRPDGSVELSVLRENGHLELAVRDTGIGIAPEAREHIFERFYRADPSRHCDGMNAGLGLAIVKGYVDLLGGSIIVESTLDKGSTFRVLLEADS
jgi:heavy metal sensor kinase